jgi:hypothetical protein
MARAGNGECHDERSARRATFYISIIKSIHHINQKSNDGHDIGTFANIDAVHLSSGSVRLGSGKVIAVKNDGI